MPAPLCTAQISAAVGALPALVLNDTLSQPSVASTDGAPGAVEMLADTRASRKNREALLSALSSRAADLSWENKAVLVRLLQAESSTRTSRRMPTSSSRAAAALLCGTQHAELTAMKEALNAGSLQHDLDALVFRHLRRLPEQQAQVLQHFAVQADRTYSAPGAPPRPLHLVTDFDDTIQANWLDRRVPRGTVYPGALQFLRELRHRPHAGTSPTAAAVHRRMADKPPTSASSGQSKTAKLQAWVQRAATALLRRDAATGPEAEWSDEADSYDGLSGSDSDSDSNTGTPLPKGLPAPLPARNVDDAVEVAVGSSATSDAAWSRREALSRALHPPHSEPGATGETLGSIVVLTARPAGARNLIKSRTLRHIRGLGLEPVSLLAGSLLHLTSLSAIGQRKFDNLQRFFTLFPEADVVLLGDSGQADAAFMAAAATAHPDRVRACFLHDIAHQQPTTGDGGHKAQYALDCGMRLFQTYPAAATAAMGAGLLCPAAALRVAAAASVEFEELCRGLGRARITQGLEDAFPPYLQELLRSTGAEGGPLGLSSSRPDLGSSQKWQQRLTAMCETLTQDVAQLVAVCAEASRWGALGMQAGGIGPPV